MNEETQTEFNPDLFIQDAIEGEMSTKMELIPKGEYIGFIDSQKPINSVRLITPNDPSKQPFFAIAVNVILDAPEVSEAIGRSRLSVRYEILADRDPITGTLHRGKGKNVKLGRLRELVGQNNPGPWSLGMLAGAGPLLCKVDYKEDNRDSQLPIEERRVYETIVAVTAPQ